MTGLDNGMRGADGIEGHTREIETKDEQVKDGTVKSKPLSPQALEGTRIGPE